MTELKRTRDSAIASGLTVKGAIKTEKGGSHLLLNDCSGENALSLRLEGGGEEPYNGEGEIVLCSENIFDDSAYKYYTYSGVTLTKAENGVKMTGTATRSIYINLLNKNVDSTVEIPRSMRGQTLTFYSYGNSIDVEIGFYYINSSGKLALKNVIVLRKSGNYMASYTITNETQYWVRFRFYEGKTYNDTIKLMCCIGNGEARDFVPYKEYARVSVPREITLNDGSLLSLDFKGVDEAGDLLVASRINNRVIYKRRVGVGDEGAYLLARSEDFDITKTSLGRALLALETPLFENGLFKVNFNKEPRSVELAYFSRSARDECALEIRYLSDSGEQIAKSKEFFVRKGAYFQALPIEIAGKRPKTQRMCGIIKEDTVITFVYEEEA